MLEQKDIAKLAALARIDISSEEQKSLLAEIQSILKYVEQVQDVKAAEGPREAGAHRNVMRGDTNPHESGIHTDMLLAEAPGTENGYVKVKKIL